MKKNKQKFGNKFVDVVSSIPVFGFILSMGFSMVFSMLTSPFFLISIGSTGYIFKDYASIDGIKLIATVNKSNSWNKFAQCAVMNKSVDLGKMKICLTDKSQGSADIGEAMKALEAASASQSQQMENLTGNSNGGNQQNKNGNNENDAQKSMLSQLVNAFAKSTESK